MFDQMRDKGGGKKKTLSNKLNCATDITTQHNKTPTKPKQNTFATISTVSMCFFSFTQTFTSNRIK